MSNVNLIAEARRNAPESVDESLIMRLVVALEASEPRVITTVEEVDALPIGSQLLDSDPSLCQKIEQGWVLPGGDEVFENADITLPATVLREPTT